MKSYASSFILPFTFFLIIPSSFFLITYSSFLLHPSFFLLPPYSLLLSPPSSERAARHCRELAKVGSMQVTRPLY